MSALYESMHQHGWAGWDDRYAFNQDQLFRVVNGHQIANYDVDVDLDAAFWSSIDGYADLLAQHDGVMEFRGRAFTVQQHFGDAAPSGTALIGVDADGQVVFQPGVWPATLAGRSSNWRELRTIVSRLPSPIGTPWRSQ